MKLKDRYDLHHNKKVDTTDIGIKRGRYWEIYQKVLNIKVVSFVLVWVLISFIVYFLYLRYQNLKDIGVNDLNVSDFINYITSAVSNENNWNLSNEKRRTNFLIIGVDKRNSHDSLLTDTIIILSYDYLKNQAVYISVPRDLRVNYENSLVKINSVFPFSYQNNLSKKLNAQTSLDKAFDDLIKVINSTIGINVHYGVLIDFEGFKKIIDLLGGIDVYVERSFIDYEFPNNPDTGTMKVSFQEGWQKMNGERALQYARSRKGNNNEGTDYARAKRQQIILNAVKEKFLKSNFFTQTVQINDILNILGQHIRLFNFKSSDIDGLIKYKDKLLDFKSKGMVISPEIGNHLGHILKTGDFGDGLGWVIYPVKNNYSDLVNYIQLILYKNMIDVINIKIYVCYTNKVNYDKYLNLKKIFYDNFLKFDFNNDLLCKLNDEVNGNNNHKLKIYLLNKNISDDDLIFFKDLFGSLNIEYEIISSDHLKLDNQTETLFNKKYDLIIVY